LPLGFSGFFAIVSRPIQFGAENVIPSGAEGGVEESLISDNQNIRGACPELAERLTVLRKFLNNIPICIA